MFCKLGIAKKKRLPYRCAAGQAYARLAQLRPLNLAQVFVKFFGHYRRYSH